MKNSGILQFIACVVLALAFVAGPAIAQGNNDNIVVSLQIDTDLTPPRVLSPDNIPVHMENDTIAMKLNIQAAVPGPVVVPANFSSQQFHLFLVFTAPDGSGVRSLIVQPTLEPPPPFIDPTRIVPGTNEYPQLEIVEILPGTSAAGGAWHPPATILKKIQEFYPVYKIGRYSAKAVIPGRIYAAADCVVITPDGPVSYADLGNAVWTGTFESNAVRFSIVDDKDCDGAFFPDGCRNCPPASHCTNSPVSNAKPDCNDNNKDVYPGAPEIAGDFLDNDCDPTTSSDVPAASPKGTVVVQADLHIVGGGSYPVAKKSPLIGLPVKAVSKAQGSCAAKIGIFWQNYKAIWEQCPAEGIGGSGLTGPSGAYTFIVNPGDYLVVGHYQTAAENLYMGGSVGPVAANQTAVRYLQTIQKNDGKQLPAKYTKLTGSELLIIEPEYVEWTGATELYPFIFESIGAWGVTTVIAPPKGFVADQKALSADVNNAVKAVQFTVTDIGSDWVDTLVEHTVKYKNKTQKIKSQIGVIKKK